MASRLSRTIAVAAAGAGLVLSLAGSAQASGGSYSARLADGCGSASGTYHWYATSVYNGKQAYKTDWDFALRDLCSTNSYAVSLYAKYTKWNGSSWTNDGRYHKIGSSGTDANVADVRIYLCEVGRPSTCAGIH
ncbi:hypothetical protein ACFYXM_32325 [Streptomyces sp. NPDC002476]|uniref:hypothetical protein n=1 Tax=Streptomyces sp. NPDC002476 TaxID=3364648 RepID=UPI003689E384